MHLNFQTLTKCDKIVFMFTFFDGVKTLLTFS